MKYVLIAALLLLSFSSAHAEEERTARMGRLKKILSVAEKSEETPSGADSEYDGRPYEMHYPPNMVAGKKYPLVAALHGGGGSSNHIQRHLKFNPAADKHGFIVAYLNGNQGKNRLTRNLRTWNGGGCCGNAVAINADDVGYIDGFIKMISTQQPVDTSRIYMIGHSNGGIMTYRFACERPGVLAAIVPMAGAVMVPKCDAKGLRVLHVHGTDDTHVLVGGGAGPDSVVDVDFPSVAESQKAITDAGAVFTPKMVVGAGHSLDSINEVLVKTDKKTLAETVASFLDR